MALVEALTRIFDVDATWLMVGPDDEPLYVHNSSSARLTRVHRAIQEYAAEAGVLLPVERTDGLALSVVREPIAYEAPILRTIREAIFLESGRSP